MTMNMQARSNRAAAAVEEAKEQINDSKTENNIAGKKDSD